MARKRSKYWASGQSLARAVSAMTQAEVDAAVARLIQAGQRRETASQVSRSCAHSPKTRTSTPSLAARSCPPSGKRSPPSRMRPSRRALRRPGSRPSARGL